MHGHYPVPAIIQPATQPAAIRLQEAWSALQRNEGDWPKLVLGVAQALRAGREAFRNVATGEVDDRAFGHWLDENALADIPKGDRAALLKLAELPEPQALAMLKRTER